MTKRGRKIDPNLPPSRSRDIQRAFRARRAAYIAGLEDRVRELELENRALKIRLGEDPAPIEDPEDEDAPPKKRTKVEDDDPEEPRQPSYNLRVGPNARPTKAGASSASSVKTETGPARPAIAVAIPPTQPQEPYEFLMGSSSVPVSFATGHSLASAPSLLPGSPLSVVSAPPTFLRAGQQQPSTGTPGEELPFWLDRFSLPPTPGESVQGGQQMGSSSFDDQRRFVMAPRADVAYGPSRSALPNPVQSTIGHPPLSPALTSTSPFSGSSASSGGEDGSPVNVHVKVEDDHAPVLNHFCGTALPDGVEPFGFGWSTSPFAPPFQTPPINVPMPSLRSQLKASATA